MNVVLWVVQVPLAVIFLFHGRILISPPPGLTDGPRGRGMKYVRDLNPSFRNFIGAAEVLAATGLVLPSLTGVLPWLTPLAAAGLVILMASAIVFHVARREYSNLAFNFILLALAALVAYGRLVVVPA